MQVLNCVVIFTAAWLLGLSPAATPPGIQFVFKNKTIHLSAGMQSGADGYFPRGRFNNARLDTMSNWHNPVANYVEIIRQDDPLHPTIGIALGFEFDEDNGEYPYTPARAVLQLKDFGWGGVEFSRRDTLNYTGVSNQVSDDLQIEVDGFENDTIWGRFSGVLVSGAGPMAAIDSGTFRVRLYRME
jgi:hypothetical protein